MADRDPKPEKPYRFDTIKKPVTPTDFAMWESTLWDYLKAIPRNKPLLKKSLKWTTDVTNHRGFLADTTGDNRLTAEDKADILESILLKIGTYGPKSIFIDITKRSTSYKYISDAIRRVCGFPVPGAQLIQYMCVKNSFDTTGTETFNDFYWRLRDEKIASLMTTDSGVTFHGSPLDQDETITPSMENQVVADWLEGIGGIRLVKYIGQEYAKDLEKISIADLQETLGQQEIMRSILDRMDIDEVAKLHRAQTFDRNNRQPGQRGAPGQHGPPGQQNKQVTFEERLCYFCKEMRNGKHKTHNTGDCFLRQKYRQQQKGSGQRSKNFQVDTLDQSSSDDESEVRHLSTMLDDMRSYNN